LSGREPLWRKLGGDGNWGSREKMENRKQEETGSTCRAYGAGFAKGWIIGGRARFCFAVW
jgi:hypothetical protein